MNILLIIQSPLIAYIITIIYAMIIQPPKQHLITTEYMIILGVVIVSIAAKSLINHFKCVNKH